MICPPRTPLAVNQLAASMILLVGASFGWCGDAAVSESFDYPTGAQVPIYEGGAGWSARSGKTSWRVGSKEPIAEPNIIAPESLHFTLSQGWKFPSTGNKAFNAENVVVWISRGVDAESGSLSELVVPATTTAEENLERSVAGIGAAGGTIWLSTLVFPGHGNASIRLCNSAYNMAANGVLIKFDLKRNRLVCGQDWYRVKGAEVLVEADPKVGLNEPIWLVAQVTFGKEWGSNAASANFDATKNVESPVKPEGRLLIWLNPSPHNEPTASTATVDLPLLEFRINRVAFTLEPGTAADEFRMGKSFNEINH